MRIVRCPSCGRLVHMDDKCLFCQSTLENTAVCLSEVHENARDAFDKAETLVKQGHFDAAQNYLCEVMKWSPNSSEVHWLRLLARTGCKNDRELFYSGAHIAESTDYDTALRYAGGEEKQTYSAVGDACAELKNKLLGMIRSRNSMMMNNLDLENVLSDMRQFISIKRNDVLAAWQELRSCEQELKLLENEGIYSIHECVANTQHILNEAAEIRESLEDTDEISRKQFFTYKAKLDGMKRTAESAKEEYYRLRAEHPSLGEFAELSQKRDSLKHSIKITLDEIKAYELKIEAVIARMNSVNENGEKLLKLVESGDYEQVKAVLGQSEFERAAQYALSLK